MGESDDPRQQSKDEEPKDPLKEGIDEAKAGDTASLEDILSELD